MKLEMALYFRERFAKVNFSQKEQCQENPLHPLGNVQFFILTNPQEKKNSNMIELCLSGLH